MLLRSVTRLSMWHQKINELTLKRSLYQLRKIHPASSKQLISCQSSIIDSNNNDNKYTNNLFIRRGIKTTNKKDEVHVEVYDREYIENADKKPIAPESAKEFADVSSQKNWISFGYDRVDQKEDYHLANAYFFSYFTLGVILFVYVVYHYPYYDGYDWAQREAFLELDRRERLGLPLIDPNLVDPAKVTLPSDEELGDFEIHL